ncbi:MAG: hypothetical protein KDA84_26300 [Planctomycetaceae bacterium]|nr:hypothetical protein [Planctomycetaceae bacterium]
MKLSCATLVAVLGFFVTGCGKDAAYEGPPRVALSGRVTIDGQTVDGGTISFIPQSPNLRVTGGPISNGLYSIVEEKGAHEGGYRVEIRCPKPNGKKFKDSDTGEMKDQLVESVPAKFNTKSTLSVSVSPQNSTLHFDLKSK